MSVLLFSPGTRWCLLSHSHAPCVIPFLSAPPSSLVRGSGLCAISMAAIHFRCACALFFISSFVFRRSDTPRFALAYFFCSFLVCATCVHLPHAFEANRLFRSAFTQSHHFQTVAAAWLQRSVLFTLLPNVYIAFSSVCREQTERRLCACHYALPTPI